LTQSDAARARAQLAEANSTLNTRLREAWCWLLYPSQSSAHEDIELIAGKISAQDNVLVRATKKLVSEEALFTELGPVRLNRDLEKYIWGDKPHLKLSDLAEYHNRYVYLPRLKDRTVLAKCVLGAISQAVPGPFAYAETFDDEQSTYHGIVIEQGGNTPVVIDNESLTVRPDIANENRPALATAQPDSDTPSAPAQHGGSQGGISDSPGEKLPTRFKGTVILSSDRPARDMHQVVEAIVEHLTTIPDAKVEL